MKKLCLVVPLVFAVTLTQIASFAQDTVLTRSLTTASIAGAPSLRESDRAITTLARSGELHRLAIFTDPLAPGRRHERFQQTVNGVPVWASTLTRQSDDSGIPISIFGDLYEGLDTIATDPRLSPEEARRIVGGDVGAELGQVASPLYVLVTPGGPRLVYVVRAATPTLELFQY